MSEIWLLLLLKEDKRNVYKLVLVLVINMEKSIFYGIEHEELDSVMAYLGKCHYHMREEEDASITIFDINYRIVGTIDKIGGLCFSGIPNLNTDDSRLERVLDEFMNPKKIQEEDKNVI